MEKTSTNPATSPKASPWNSGSSIFWLRCLLAASVLALPLIFPAAGPQSVQAGKNTPAKAATAAPRLTDIKAVAAADHARATLFLDARTDFSSEVIAAAKDQPRRLVIEFRNAALAAKVAMALDQSGPLKRIRAQKRGQGALRVEMEIAEQSEHTVFTMDDPFRIVVDVSVSRNNSAGVRPAAPESGKKRPPASAAREENPSDRDEPTFTPVSLGSAPRSASGDAAKPGKNGAPYKLQDGSMRQAASLVRQLNLTVRTIMIDPGHGGKDNGATGVRGLHEKDVNLVLAKILGEKLASLGFTVLYTRTRDVFVPLDKRTEMANESRADLFVSIHCNSHPQRAIHGLETYSLNLARTSDAARVAARENAGEQRKIGDLQMILTDLMLNSKIKESVDLASSVQKSVVSGLRRSRPIADHGVHEAPFFVLMGARMPAVLVEVGFVTNPEEALALGNRAYLDHLADGLAEGVLRYKSKIERYASL